MTVAPLLLVTQPATILAAEPDASAEVRQAAEAVEDAARASGMEQERLRAPALPGIADGDLMDIAMGVLTVTMGLMIASVVLMTVKGLSDGFGMLKRDLQPSKPVQPASPKPSFDERIAARLAELQERRE